MNIGTFREQTHMICAHILSQYGYTNTYTATARGLCMPKVSLDIPKELFDDIKLHVGDDKKFVSLADAIRTACRKMLDQLDSIDLRHGRRESS